jgi:hypothetical protein
MESIFALLPGRPEWNFSGTPDVLQPGRRYACAKTVTKRQL